MNFLAHFYLSASDPKIITGNFLGDMMRKVEWEQLPIPVQRGVKMHHFIDDFTDSHPITKLHKTLIAPNQGHYAPVVVDILYDHLLAQLFDDYSGISLDNFSQNIYHTLQQEVPIFNKKANITFHYMRLNNWLLAYQSKEGLERIFRGMHSRSLKKSNMELAYDDFVRHEVQISTEFSYFFEDLEKACISYLNSY